MRKIWLFMLLVCGFYGISKADNTNPQAILFVNTVVRPMADKLAQDYYQCKTVYNTWLSQNLGLIIPVDGSLIDDGSTCDKTSNPGCKGDGRNPVSDNDINVFISQCASLISGYEASNNTNLNGILKVSVNP